MVSFARGLLLFSHDAIWIPIRSEDIGPKEDFELSLSTNELTGCSEPQSNTSALLNKNMLIGYQRFTKSF